MKATCINPAVTRRLPNASLMLRHRRRWRVIIKPALCERLVLDGNRQFNRTGVDTYNSKCPLPVDRLGCINSMSDQ